MGTRQAAQGPITQETARTPDTSSVKPKPVTLLPPAQPGPEPGGVSAGQAAPKAKTSSEVEAPFHYVFFFEGDTVRQFHLYNDRSRAEAAEPLTQ